MQKKGSSIVWNHHQADPEFGLMQARELRYHLQGVLAAFPVDVAVGKGYVEVCPNGINKGAMAERMIEETMALEIHGKKLPLQFVLCCGDDSSDELMFSALHSKVGMCPAWPLRCFSFTHATCVALQFGRRPTDINLFTVTVGRKPSEASSYMADYNDVVELLKMAGSIHANKAKRLGKGSMSVNDMGVFDTGREPVSSNLTRRLSGE